MIPPACVSCQGLFFAVIILQFNRVKQHFGKFHSDAKSSCNLGLFSVISAMQTLKTGRIL